MSRMWAGDSGIWAVVSDQEENQRASCCRNVLVRVQGQTVDAEWALKPWVCRCHRWGTEH